jgi:hypothetical protein
MSEPRTRRGAREEETPDVGAPQTPSAADKSKGWGKPPENPAKQQAAERPWRWSVTGGASPTGALR